MSTRGWSKSSRASPFALGLATLLGSAQIAQAGVFNAHLEKYEQCVQAAQFDGKHLAAYSKTGSLYVHRLTSDDEGSMSYRMMKPHGLSGFIWASKATPESAEVADGEKLVITGVMYRRDASFFEKILANGADVYYYEVVAPPGSYLLSLEQLQRLPLPVCKAKKRG